MLFTIIQSQAAWFAAVLLAANGQPWLAAFVATALTLLYIAVSRRRMESVVLVLSAAIVGTIADSGLAQLHLINFASGALIPGLTSPWMVALWMNFATVLHGALRMLRERPALSCVFGAVGGPLAYAAGARLGALSFPSTPLALVAVAIEWAIALPLLCGIANRYALPRSAPVSALAGLLALSALRNLGAFHYCLSLPLSF